MEWAVDLSRFGYLGLRHGRDELPSWDRLSAGRPSAVDEADPLAGGLAARMAALQGCEAAMFAPSSLHAFWDLFGCLSEDDVIVYVDEGTYPIAQWGIDRAAAYGVAVQRFSHHDPEALAWAISQDAADQRRPVVVVDGISGRRWSPAPLRELLRCIEPLAGLLVLDDTQATGLLGHSPGPDAPFGQGGGGSLRWHGIESPGVILVSSLTKGFGVPITVISGSLQLVEWMRQKSQTRVHCSPPSIPHLLAVEHALDVNESEGDALRDRLAENIRHFRTVWPGVRDIAATNPPFPVQILALPPGADSAAVDAGLRARGVRGLLQESADEGVRLLLIITAAHGAADVRFAARVVTEVVEETPRARPDQGVSATRPR